MSSVQFAGSSDGRRRRRLVTNHDTATHSEGSSGRSARSLPDYEPAAHCAAVPWVPQTFWKLWTAAGILAVGLAVLSVVLIQRPAFRPQLAPLFEPLVRGSRSPLFVFVEVLLGFAATQLCWLIGWHRARSRLDFRGRYRVWMWAVAYFAAVTFCLSTGWHLMVGRTASRFNWLAYRPESVSWLLPGVALGGLTWMLLDREFRRNRSALVLFRTGGLLLLASAASVVWEAEVRPWSLLTAIRPAIELFGYACVAVALWFQLHTVGYVTCDPWVAPARPVAVRRGARKVAPVESAAPRSWMGRVFRFVTAPIRLMHRWLTKETLSTEEAPPKGRRRKVDDAESAAKPRRKARKPATRTRTRRKLSVDDDADETSGEMDVSDSSGEGDTAADEWTRNDDAHAPAARGPHQATSRRWAEQQQLDEPETEEELERLTNPRGSSSYSRDGGGSHDAAADDDDRSDSGDDEWSPEDDPSGDSQDSDANHGGRALSKKQRREMKRQQKQGR